ncbi:GGDEF domain-containing protein, partial [Chloroflexota bacterium]
MEKQGKLYSGKVSGAYFFQKDKKIVLFTIFAFNVLSVVFLYSDSLLFGLNNTFYSLLWMRALFFLSSFVFTVYLLKATYSNKYEWFLLAWWLIFIALILFVNLTRPDDYIHNTTIDAVIVLTSYLVFYNRLEFQIIPAAMLSLITIVQVVWFKSVDYSAITYIVNFFTQILVHTVGIYFSDSRKKYRLNEIQYLINEQELKNKLEELAYTDELTGIFNRRMIFKIIQEEFDRYSRYQGVYSLMMVDVDRFKAVNDSFGHAVGDLVLQALVNMIQLNMR